jgi:hypothetical protein
MTAANLPHFTSCGLPGIDRVPFGVHACHFYRNREELIAATVPYFTAGLRSNQRCLWVTAAPLPASEAIQALRAVWDGVDVAIQSGALRILDFDQWYTSDARLNGLDVVQLWLAEEERALAEGYNGLRITGNTSFLKSSDWKTFMGYEQALTARFRGRRIVTLCSYALTHCSAQQTREVMDAHHCTFERPYADWQVVANPKNEEWVRNMGALSIPGWASLTTRERIELCREYAQEAEQRAQAASADRKDQFKRLAQDWHQIAQELEQFDSSQRRA